MYFYVLFTGLSPTAPPPCVDVKSDCDMYETGFCDRFKPWARDNCRKTCNLCGKYSLILVQYSNMKLTFSPVAV